ncbi:1-acyl-sn-glycerol-3-phosphate acyltransferase [Christensenellaceae bacterium OttesenSCG-928-M15]|nr:1-acyl-sn-glycerol-3-phosphate acyltransferase [Christensenellaceae bacterium OttesenSCG-928-M15]
MLYILLKILVTPLMFLIFRPRVYGREHLKVKGGAIFICNHVSMIDAALLVVISPRIIHFMAKAELFQSKIGNLFFRLLFAFPIDRTRSDLVSVKKAMRVLKANKVFGIFPEGKRTITDSMDALEKGAAFLASRSDVPVVPMYIARNSYESRRIVMVVGAPIYANDLKGSIPKSQLVNVFNDKIETTLHALRDVVEEIAL